MRNPDIISGLGESMNEAIEKTEKAGKVLRKTKEEAVKLIKPGVKLLEIAEFVEKRIVELGALPAFPCNISINSDAAHFTPRKNDERVFHEGDIVKLDVGAHVDGYIADTAITVDLGDHSELVAASEEALNSAIKAIHAGVDTAELGRLIDGVIKEFGYKPIVNLTGHGLQRWMCHAPPTIYNFSTRRGVVLERGAIIAIEPFVTDGTGKVVERNEVEIYSLASPKPVRMKQERELLEEIKQYKTLPFAKRWLKSASDLIINRLVRSGVLRAYPVLTEAGKGMVSQSEHTVIVEEDGARVVT